MTILHEQELVTVVFVGHVDHGKSTLIGRLLVDSGKVPEDRVSSVARLCQEKGIGFEPAFLLDGFEEEREQGITIDTTRVNFEHESKRFCIIDAPGHAEFLRNMTTAASQADVGVLVIDCQQGPRAQTVQHIRSLVMLGIRDAIVVINKMDKLAYSEAEYEDNYKKVHELLLREKLRCLAIVPVSAYSGINIFELSDKMPWYSGPSLMQVLSELEHKLQREPEQQEPFRMVLQDVYRFDDERYFVGQVLSGQVSVGNEITFSPSAKTAIIKEIRQYPAISLSQASRGQSIALTLAADIFLERGEIVSRTYELPEIETEFVGSIVWLGNEQFEPSSEYLLKIGTAESKCTLIPISGTENDEPLFLQNGMFSEVLIKTEHPVAFDSSGSGIVNFVICSKWETAAAGVIVDKSETIAQVLTPKKSVFQEIGYVERHEFESMNGHQGAVVWLTGLSGAGKSTVAKTVERELFTRGHRVTVLDADNLRLGLCADLGFSASDRAENVRRIAQMARLLVNTGTIVLVACVSPYKKDREIAREIIGKDSFLEVFVFCPLEVCQKRDSKGLYAKSRSGQLPGLSGIGSPYQPPSSPSLRLNSSDIGPEVAGNEVLELLLRRKVISSVAGSKIEKHLQVSSGANAACLGANQI